ncbi:MAG: ribosome assembly factor SBDS [Candidatus Pacearchaeota archaeon]|nr:ribosome assembly factor SBDS [Candidatus Pacearchaeota archaeon]
MTQTTARIKQTGKPFEIIVDLDRALKFKRGLSTNIDFLDTDLVFTDSKRGLKASEKDLKDAFGTNDINAIASRIVKNGEVLLTQEHRDEARENKVKQVIDFLSRNATDPKTGNPHTSERIKNALEQAQVNIKNTPVESQMNEIIEKISPILPIRLQTKKIKITVPAVHTGKAYGILSQYKENENWLGNGDLEITINIPSGLLMDFYDKLNSITHGSAVTEEVNEK